MMTIEDKLRDLKALTIKKYENDIKLYQMFLSDNITKKDKYIYCEQLKAPKEEIQKRLDKTINELEYYKNDNIDDDITGWDYFDDVCYLDKEEKIEFDKTMRKDFGNYNLSDYPKIIIFESINKIVYLSIEISRLELTQEKFNKDRIRKEVPDKEALKILEFIGDNHELTEPLVRFLVSMPKDYHDKLSHKQREIYFDSKKESIKYPSLNIDRLKNLKNEKKRENNKLLSIIKNHKNRYAKDVFKEITSFMTS